MHYKWYQSSHLDSSHSTKEVIVPLRILSVNGDAINRHSEIPEIKKEISKNMESYSLYGIKR